MNSDQSTAVHPISTPVEVGLRFAGIWPAASHRTLLRLAWILSMGIGQTLQYWYIVDSLGLNDLSDLVDGLSTTLPYTLIFLKLIIFWFNHRKVVKIVSKMSIDWSDSGNRTTNAMLEKAALANRCAKLILGVYSMAVFLYSSTSFELSRSPGKTLDPQSRLLLIKMKIPASCFQSPAYECVMFVQFLQLFAVAFSIGVIDALVVTLMLHIGGQIEIMHHVLATMSTEQTKYGLSSDSLRSLLNRHNKIIAFSNDIQSLFTHIALLQFLSNTLIICCIGFVIISSFDSEEGLEILIKSSLFYVAITLEAFVFCFSGEYLRGKSEGIRDAAYDSPWYSLRPKESRVLLLVMLRSQKLLTITAGNFVDLSLESFAGILKASASYISVLHAIN